MKRRQFLQTVTVAASVSAASGGPLRAGPSAAELGAADQLPRPTETVRGDMRYRALGRTGEQVSVLGLGGHHIGRQKEEAQSMGGASQSVPRAERTASLVPLGSRDLPRPAIHSSTSFETFVTEELVPSFMAGPAERHRPRTAPPG